MKVFSINDCDWYMANTLEEAILIAMADTGLPRDEATDDPCELTEAQMNKLMFTDDNGVKRTFAAELQRRIDAGKKCGMFASTEF